MWWKYEDYYYPKATILSANVYSCRLLIVFLLALLAILFLTGCMN